MEELKTTRAILKKPQPGQWGVPRQVLLMNKSHIRQAWPRCRRLTVLSQSLSVRRALEVWLSYESHDKYKGTIVRVCQPSLLLQQIILKKYLSGRPLWPVYFVLSGIPLLLHRSKSFKSFLIAFILFGLFNFLF